MPLLGSTLSCLYLALLGSTTFNYGSTLAWLYLALSSSTTLYYGSTTFSHGYNSVYMNGVSMYMNIPTSYPPSGLMMNAIIILLAYFIYSHTLYTQYTKELGNM